MEQANKESTDSKPTKLIHVKVVGGGTSEVLEIGKYLQKYCENAEEELGYKLKALITNDHIVLQDVDAMIKELWKLKKQLDAIK